MTVKYFTSRIPGDANQRNRHALVNEKIEFFAFPYQPYLARNSKKSVVISDFNAPDGKPVWVVRVYTLRNDGSGEMDLLKNEHFTLKDNAFEYGAKELE